MKRMRKKGTYLQQGSRCSAAQPPARPSAVLGLAACTTLCGLTSQFTETPGLGEGTPSPSRAGGLGRKARPADPSHGQGGLLPLSRPPHSLPVCARLSLCPMHSPQGQQPQPLTALEKGTPSRIEEGQARGPSMGKKKRWGEEQHVPGVSQELCDAPSLTPSPQPHPLPRTAHPRTTLSPLYTHTHMLLPHTPVPARTTPPFCSHRLPHLPLTGPHTLPALSCPFISPVHLSSSLPQPSMGRVSWHRPGRTGKRPVCARVP